MSRHRINALVTEVKLVNGRRHQLSVSGADVDIFEEGTTTPVQVYDAEAGDELTPPFTTDASGRVIDQEATELWVDSPQNLTVVATKDAQTWTIFYPALSADDMGPQGDPGVPGLPGSVGLGVNVRDLDPDQ